MRRRKNGLPAMLALTILLSGISEQSAHQSYVYAEQIEALEDLNRHNHLGMRHSRMLEIWVSQVELPASGEAGTNETGDKRYRTGDRNWIRKRVRDRGCIVSRKARPETEDKSETRESESETASEVETRIRN